MLSIKLVLGGLGLNAIVFSFKPHLGATCITLVSSLITIKSLSYFC
jgi:hypothetical protein